MKYLSDLSGSSKDDKLNSLHKLVDLYVDWTDKLKTVSKTLDPRFATIASKTLPSVQKLQAECMQA